MSSTAPAIADNRLFTSRFFLLGSFSFMTFFAGFQLFPTMPMRILALGGTESQAGLFLGFLTFSSAVSAPFGGAIADRLGRRLILITSSIAFIALSGVFAVTRDFWILLPTAVVFGVFWSALLAASFALMTGIIPASRRAEGIGYAGIAGTLAIAISPSVGLAVYQLGWLWLCGTFGVLAVAMLAIAITVPDHHEPHPAGRSLRGLFSAESFESRVFIVSISLMLYSFGHGGITSFVALYAQQSGTRPEGIFFIVFAVTVCFSRPFAGRLADRRGRRKILLPCFALVFVGQAVLAYSGSFWAMVASACIFGLGMGSAFPVFASMVLDHIDEKRRGSAFGSILLAFDSGIGSGSMLNGVMIDHYGFHVAYGVSAAVSLFSIPYFLMTERLLRGNQPTTTEIEMEPGHTLQ